MATLMPMEAPRAGFNFENCKRNALLAKNGYQPPKVNLGFEVLIIYVVLVSIALTNLIKCQNLKKVHSKE